MEDNKTQEKFTNNPLTFRSTAFLSQYGHLGIELSQRDDLISFGYVLVYLFKGDLAWHKIIQKPEIMQEIKMNTTNERLCKGMPEEFVEYFEYVKNIKYSEKPDYGILINLFKKMMKKKDFKDDGIFDWSLKNCQEGIDLSARRISGPPLEDYKKKLRIFEKKCEYFFFKNIIINIIYLLLVL